MGGGSIKIEGFHSLPDPHTMVLMGRTGNGKSATANSVLGRKAFVSKVSSGGVTATAELQTATFKDGQVVNVIDTPGLFDFKVGYETVSQEIMKCISLGKDGIHAVLLVFSVTNRFTVEEESAVRALQAFFGPKITEYIIVIFTGGDTLEEDDQSLDDYLNNCCPELKEVLKLCNNRHVLFDNKTKDEKKKELQLEKLLSLVDNVIEENCGQPYTDSLFAEYKEAALIQQKIEEVNDSKGQITSQELAELTEKIQKSYDDQLKRMTEMIASKMKTTSDTLLKELERERAAREKAEKAASDARKKSEDAAKKRELERERAAREKAEKAAHDARKKSENEAKNREELKRERAAREKAEKAARDARKKLEDESKKREEDERRLHDEHNARMRVAAELNSRPQFCAIM